MSFLRCLTSSRIGPLPAAIRSSPSHAYRRYRQFSVTARKTSDEKAKQDMMSLVQELGDTKLFKEIKQNQALMTSIQEAVQVLQEEGFDPNKRTHMMMLVTNPRIREKMSHVAKAIEEAGIDPTTAREAFELVKSKLKPKE